jgi:CubicO group peptidase (beta-lactamase class C family)
MAAMHGLEVPDGFSGVISVTGPDGIDFESAYGPADRAHGVAMTTDTQLAIASGTKGFTAATVLGLIDDGAISLDTTARSVLGADLPLIADDVTVAHLLTHRSGIGDYVDEDLSEEQPLRVPPGALDSTPAYLPALDGFATKFPAGSRFSYCNGGYVVLALIAERVARTPFEEFVHRRVFEPAGMTDSAFLRSDRLPGRAALGYLDDGRTNVFALPVLGSGDGGAYSTVADVRSFWAALPAGRIVSQRAASLMCHPSTSDTGHAMAYGMGLWLTDGYLVLEGADQGVSFRSLHDPVTARTATVVSNTGAGAWPIARQLRDRM